MNTPQHPQHPPLRSPAAPVRPNPPAQHNTGHPPKIAAMPTIGHKPTDEELAPLELIGDDPAPAVNTGAATTAEPVSKIRAFSVKASAAGKHDFERKPVVDGHGACRVRTFHGRLSDEGLAYMDDKINEWLDHHPEIEVKFVTSTVGVFEGKIREPALVLNVWY
jgi:hypothetical protein